MKRRTCALAMLALLGALAWAARAADEPAPAGKLLRDEWRAMYVGDRRAGFEHETTQELDTAGGVFFVTTDHSEATFLRAGVSLHMVSDAVVREDAQGRVVEYQIKSPVTQTMHGALEGDHFSVMTTGRATSTVHRMPPPKGLGPWAAEQLSRKKGYEPGTRYAMDVFRPDDPEKSARATVEVGPVETVKIFGVEKRLHPLTVTDSLTPGLPSKEWRDDDGTEWLERAALMPQVEIESRKTTRELATLPPEPAELLMVSYITPDKPIERPRELEGMQVLLTPVEAGTPVPDVPQDAGQKVSTTEQGMLVTVARAHAPQESYELPYRGQDYADQLRANKWLEVGDSLIQQMAREAVGDATDPVTAAHRIEAYVYRKIRANGLGVGIATAGETARSLTGDCTEHSMLAAALARAAGMPSRLVSGLAYVERLPGTRHYGFGYHMWVEVYVGKWLPIDPTLGGHDATHIALARSDMNEPGAEIAMSATISQFLGRIDIHVVQTTY